MTRCAGPSLFAGIASFLSAATRGRFRLIIGYEASHTGDLARDGAAIIEGLGGHALLMPRALPAPLTAFSVRMVMADGALYIRSSGEALIYLGGRAVDRSREGALASEAELSLIDEAAAAVSDEAALPRAEGGWECVGEGMIGAYVDRTVSRISSLSDATHVPTPVSVEDPTGLLTSLLERLGVPIDEAGAGLSLRVRCEGRTLCSSLSEEQVRTALGEALATSPAIPAGRGLYCVDPAFVMDADAISAGAVLALLAPR
ncbi:phosphomannomutase [uncultured Actinomyces sp.]|uniref:phosphomannomutase n=1 Tax=uncultured Actinomyces sp. TaxID=249061 RepID=UPI0028E46B7C|nr:phosphomannomutase [uncultured Actinomyces sp.]